MAECEQPEEIALNKRRQSDSSVKLKRELGLFSAVNYILGVMIGSGIFVSSSSALRHSGSVGLCLIVWIISGVISFLGALSYAELGTVVGKSGSDFSYFLIAFGKLHKFWGPVPAFVSAWIYVVILRPAEVAIIVMTFAEYSIRPFTEDTSDLAIKLISLCALCLMTYINITSVKLFIKLQNVFGVCKVFACMVVILAGVYHLIKTGSVGHLSAGFEGSHWNPGSLALALYSGLWAMDGWNSITVVTEEIINPTRNIPLSLSIAVPSITTLYVLMNISYMCVLSISEVIASPAVAVTFADRVLGPFAVLVPLGVAVATFGCAMSVQFGVTRVCYVAARSGHMLESFSYVNIKRLTPAPAVAFQGFITFVFIVVGNITALIDFASFLLWFFYGLAMLALLVLRKTEAEKPRPYRVPTVIPCFVLLVSMFLSVLPIVHDPSLKYLFAVAFILSGILVYAVFVYYQKTPSIMKHFTYLMQVMFVCVPPSGQKDT